MVGVIISILLLPISSFKYVDKFNLEETSYANIKNFYVYKILTGFLIFFMISLGWLGGCPAEGIFVFFSRIVTVLLFGVFFLVYLLPITKTKKCINVFFINIFFII
jgi:hypothetical protein